MITVRMFKMVYKYFRLLIRIYFTFYYSKAFDIN